MEPEFSLFSVCYTNLENWNPIIVRDYITLSNGYSLSGDNNMSKCGNLIMLVLTIKKDSGVYPDENNAPIGVIKKHPPIYPVNSVCVMGTSGWDYKDTDYFYIATNGNIRVCTSVATNSNFARATLCYITR